MTMKLGGGGGGGKVEMFLIDIQDEQIFLSIKVNYPQMEHIIICVLFLFPSFFINLLLWCLMLS